MRSYHDNFLQYRLTGNPSYQQAYQSAQQGLEQIVSSLEEQNASQRKEISDFYNEDVEGKLRNLQSETRDTQRKIVSENDQVITAEMRSQAISGGETISSTQYMILGAMSLFALGLMAWRK